MEILSNIKHVGAIGMNRFMLTFLDNSTMEVASDRSYWYSLGRTDGYAREASLVEIQYIDLYRLSNGYIQEA